MKTLITLVSLVLLGSSLVDTASIPSGGRAKVRRAESLTLNSKALQKGSESNGQTANAEAGQIPSLTDDANFINFCVGLGTLTNGLQVTGGSCNGVVMGQIPSKGQMVSSIILSPQHNQNIGKANSDFTVTVAVNNLNTGHFTNPNTTYYSAPQQLDDNGLILGHTHITIQNLGGSFNPSQPLNAEQFVFFKGVDNAAKDGKVSVDVTGGLPSGFYRVCTLSSASNHQSVLMPVAQRGAQDDCTKFSVGK